MITGRRQRWNCSPTASDAITTAGTRRARCVSGSRPCMSAPSVDVHLSSLPPPLAGGRHSTRACIVLRRACRAASCASARSLEPRSHLTGFRWQRASAGVAESVMRSGWVEPPTELLVCSRRCRRQDGQNPWSSFGGRRSTCGVCVCGAPQRPPRDVSTVNVRGAAVARGEWSCLVWRAPPGFRIR